MPGKMRIVLEPLIIALIPGLGSDARSHFVGSAFSVTPSSETYDCADIRHEGRNIQAFFRVFLFRPYQDSAKIGR